MKMKYITILIALTFSVMFASASYAEWTDVGMDMKGNIAYVDFERIRKNDGYVYFWQLSDYLEPISVDYLSAKFHIQGDCKLFRFKGLSVSFHKEPMGGGTGDTINEPDKGWYSPSPNAVDEEVLKQVCNR
jgi:hypothetical protein